MSNSEYVTLDKANEPRNRTLIICWQVNTSSAEYRYIWSPCPQGTGAPDIASDILRSWVFHLKIIFLNFSPDTYTQHAQQPRLCRFRLTAGGIISMLLLIGVL